MPAAAEVVVLILSVDEPPEVTDVGLTVAVTPLGAPATVRLTVCALPEIVAVEIVLLPLEPAAIDTAAGLALNEKSFVVVVWRMQAFCEFDHSFCTT